MSPGSTSPGDDVVGVALRVAAAIESVGGSYFVGGSLASSLQGDPRATNDIDIVLELPIGAVRSLADALGADFEVDVDMLRDAVLHGRSSNAFYLPAVLKIDLFGVGGSPFDEAEFSRRRPFTVRPTGESLVLKSPEDTVLRKLIWYRQGGEASDRQWSDIVGVLRVNVATLDNRYMDLWAPRVSVADLLERARRDSGGGHQTR